MSKNKPVSLKKWWRVALLGLVLLGGLGVGLWSGEIQWLVRGEKPLSPTEAAQEGSRGEAGLPTETKMERTQDKKVLYWKSPMDPTYISPAPGKEPVMGMDLVPVYEGEEETQAGGVVQIDPVTIQNIGVKTTTVERRVLNRPVRTVGRIDYDETTVRKMTPKVGGWIEKQYVDFTGQVVKRGGRLLEIYSPELVSTQEEYLRALQFHEQLKGSSFAEVRTGAATLLESTRTRLLFWDITPQQIRALEEKGKITKTMTLHAPFHGVIVKKAVVEGEYVKPGQDLYTIADLSEVWVYADIYEYEAPWVRPGQEAAMTLSYFPGQTYTGTVVYVYPYLKNMTRTLQVRMEFANSNDFDLKPDMWSDVVIYSPITRNGLAIPIEAVLRTGERDLTFVALEGGKFAPRELRLGAEADGYFEVLEGLNEGERVVTSAQFLINSESSLRSAIQKMLDARVKPSERQDRIHAPASRENTPRSESHPAPREGAHAGGHRHP